MALKLQESIRQLETSNEKLQIEVRIKKKLLEERKELIDQLTHEMKTPLGVIKSYAEGLSDSTDPIARVNYIEKIIQSSDELTNLIVTLLDLSAIETETIKFSREKFDFVELVETILGQLLLDIPDRKFDIDYVLPDNKVLIYYDKYRMGQVVSNLVLNARKHVKEKGIIRIKIDETDTQIAFSLFNTGDKIPEFAKDRIWEKFYKVNNINSKGNGLGLSIVSKLLKMENIEYGFNNKENGVEFYFILPKIKKDLAAIK